MRSRISITSSTSEIQADLLIARLNIEDEAALKQLQEKSELLSVVYKQAVECVNVRVCALCKFLRVDNDKAETALTEKGKTALIAIDEYLQRLIALSHKKANANKITETQLALDKFVDDQTELPEIKSDLIDNAKTISKLTHSLKDLLKSSDTLTEKKIKELRNYLNQLIEMKNVSAEFKKTLRTVLITIYSVHPLNQQCPLSQNVIPEESRIVLSSGRQYDIAYLAEYIITQQQFKEYDRQQINRSDQQRIVEMVTAKNEAQGKKLEEIRTGKQQPSHDDRSDLSEQAVASLVERRYVTRPELMRTPGRSPVYSRAMFEVDASGNLAPLQRQNQPSDAKAVRAALDSNEQQPNDYNRGFDFSDYSLGASEVNVFGNIVSTPLKSALQRQGRAQRGTLNSFFSRRPSQERPPVEENNNIFPPNVRPR